MRNFLRLFLCFSLLICLPACQPHAVYTPPLDWKYADLRMLDPADNVPASQDLIALYIRRVDNDIEIRLDLLDITTQVDCDLLLTISPSSNGDIVDIKIPASGEISAYKRNGLSIPGLQPRVARDTFLDTIVVSLNRTSLTRSGLPFQVTAFSFSTNSAIIRDQIGPASSDAPPPPQTEVLFTFWDTFPAATPAQALRMWDGAHSGPGRSRYGLHHLLSAVKANNIPVFLLDVKTSTTLSILDYMGVLPELKNLADLHLAILPDVARYDLPADALSTALDSYAFNFPSTPFLYSSVIPEQLEGNYQVLFIPSNTFGKFSTPTYPYRWKEYTIFHVPDAENYTSTYYPTADGPSLALRQALILSALDPRQSPFLLGGKLVNTSWGDPSCISPTLSYLKAHPWIRYFTPDELLTLRTGDVYGPDLMNAQPVQNLATQILPALQNTPAGPITDQAWQTYLSLLIPASPELSELRAGYFGIIGHLLVASRWASLPGSATDCTIDIDWDGQAECILASPDFFATFELSGGYIVVAFVRRTDGVHQVIAPYAQFVVGLGDPSTWDASRGSEGDPALVPGGFVDDAGPWIPQVQTGQITFTNVENKLNKTFHLTESGLQVEYSSTLPIMVQISIGLDPWRRFSANWGDIYREEAFSGGWEWALETGPQVKITTSGIITTQAFTASRAYLNESENPNFDYPAGHYIPFPLALVEIEGQNHFFITLDVR